MPREVEYTNVFERTRASTRPLVVNIGGAGSSKSYSIAQLFVERFRKMENKEMLIMRKTGPSLKLTAMKLVIDLIKDYGFYFACDHNKTDKTIRLGSNEIIFSSLDDPEKIKSTNFNYIWMEESNEFTIDDYRILDLRLREPTIQEEPNQLYLSLNPSDYYGWVKEDIIEKGEDLDIINSTYRDNPHLDQAYIDKLLKLKDQDEAYFLIYAEGKWAVVKGLIYNWDVVDLPDRPKSWFDDIFYGIDWGYSVDPAVLLRIYRKSNEFWLEELVYETGLTNIAFGNVIKDLPRVDLNAEFYCDPSEPKSRDELKGMGINCISAVTGPGIVVVRIDYLLELKIHIARGSENVIKERKKYKRKTDRRKNILKEPVGFMDHAMRAAEYGIYTHCKDYVKPFMNVGG